MTVHSAVYLHTRWDDQVALEREMLSTGYERMQTRINKARKKKDMNRLRPHRSLLKEWVEPMERAVSEYVRVRSQRRGPKPVALPLIASIDSGTCAMVALRTVLRCLGLEQRHLVGLAYEIGTSCEHEARCSAWMENDPDGWGELEGYYRSRGSNAAHMRRSRVAIFNRYVSDKLGWNDWTEDQRIRVGLDLLDLVITTTRRFRVVGDPNWSPSKGHISKRPKVLEADEELLQWLSDAMEDELVYWPVFLPTVIPPKPWDGPRGGGYWTPFVRTPFLIRFKAHQEDMRQRALDEYDAIDMPEVYSALNSVQETPWRINKRLYEVAQEAWDKDLAIAGMARREVEFVPPRPEAVEKSSEEYKLWASMAGEIRTRNATKVSQFIYQRRTLVAAARFLDEEEFYFPHMLDFRGRMYSIPSDLSPQGDDLHKGLLTFARPKPVGEEDAGWLAIHLANCFGVDKVGMDARIAWVEEREAMWRSISADPLGDRRWLDADTKKRWQALAAIFEWVRFLEEGPGMLSALPVRIDGTCNGIQHLSAMVRDEQTGLFVNLVPGEEPDDIYGRVAETLTEELIAESVQGDHNASLWMRLFGDAAPRSITKRPVMILPYGGTLMAYFKYTREWLRENDPQRDHIAKEQEKDAVVYICKAMWKAVGEKVETCREVMTWLQSCSKVASSTGLPLYWKTPSGFVVRHFYGQREFRRIKTNIDGQRIDLVAWHYKPTLDEKGQAKGIAPNFVHSMDASALVSAVNIAKSNGVGCITTVHDAFGSVAGDMWALSKCVREGFIETYREPVLEQFRAACQDVAREEKKWPELPKFGSLDIEQVRSSDYFFA